MNASEPVCELLLSVRGVGKTYPHKARGISRMMQFLLDRVPQGAEVLQGVDLDLVRGEAVGIVGRNGSGKSTLLQIACGVLTPSTGSVSRFGRVAAMLELGAGFKPEFSGRENAVLSAALLGLPATEVDRRIPMIEAFADIGEYFDRPVSEYSSGMFARLAFAVCANVDADVLVIDEVLAVGDGAFQSKCRRYIEDFLKRGAVLFVSHDENLVLSVCNRALWLEHGRPLASGAPQDVFRRYRHAVEIGGEATASRPLPSADGRQQMVSLAPSDPRGAQNAASVSPFLSRAPHHGNGGAIIDDVGFIDESGRRLETVHGGEIVTLGIRGRALRDLARPIAGFIFRDRSGQNIFGDNTYVAYRDRPVSMAAGERFEALLEFELPFLPDGTYSIAPSLIEGTQSNHVHLFWMEEAVILTVHNSPITVGKIGIPMRVEISAPRAAKAAI